MKPNISIGLLAILMIFILCTGYNSSDSPISNNGVIERVNGCQYAVFYYGGTVSAVHAGNCDNQTGHIRSQQ